MIAWLYIKAVVLKPVLGTPNHSIFCMSPSFNTPDSTHQLISRVCKTWNGCGLWGRHTKCVVAGGPQDRFENHCIKVIVQTKMKILSSFTLMSFQTCTTFFLLWNIKNIWTIYNVYNVNFLKLFMCSTEYKKSYRFEMTRGWVNYEFTFFFGELSF